MAIIAGFPHHTTTKSMIGDTYLQHQPNFSDDIQPAMMVMVEAMEARRLGKNKTRNLRKKQKKARALVLVTQ